MFKQPYDTTPCRDYLIDRIVASIAKQIVMGGSGQIQHIQHPKDNTPTGVCELIPGSAEIPPFAHPLLVNNLPAGYSPFFVVDVRNFTRLNQMNEKVVSSKLDYDTAVIRGLLQGYWYENSPNDLLGLGTYQVTIFARWLSELLTKRLALTPEVQLRVSVISAYFYLCMFQEEKNADESVKLKMASMISKAIYTSADEVIKIIEPLKIHCCAQDYVDELINSSNSARFEKFNLALLYTIVGGSWFGSNARELVAVALEHPPTFITLVAQATNERGFHNTPLGKLAKTYDKGDAAKSFLYNLWHLPIK